MNMKALMRQCVPPILLRLYHGGYGWKGNYSSWSEAKKASLGYDDIEIINKVKNSSLKVKNGEAVFERDSVLFDKIQYSWPQLAGLMYASAKSGGKMHVLDFGGSLGSSYYQNKKFLDRLNNVSWSIVEQPHFVKVGVEEFADKRLKFFYDIDEYMKHQKPNVLLLSSVIQYIENYSELLEKLLLYKFDFIIIDRTPFSLSGHDEIKRQVVPPNIYKASYPCWFLSEQKLVQLFNDQGYLLIEKFDAIDGERDGANFMGMIWEKS